MVIENLMDTPAEVPSVNLAELQRQMKNMKLPNQLTPQAIPNMPNMPGPGQQPEDDDELTLENAQAQKDLREADYSIKTGKFRSYRAGIKQCRQLIQTYPNTKYADQARQLLRKVPETYRKMYNITNEEMGL